MKDEWIAKVTIIPEVNGKYGYKNINQQSLTTQIIAHDKAVYDVSFAPNDSMFASCGEDGSVRIFDIKNLQQSSIIYECSSPLIKVEWDTNDLNLLAMIR